jgi:hypothetical protein
VIFPINPNIFITGNVVKGVMGAAFFYRPYDCSKDTNEAAFIT